MSGKVKIMGEKKLSGLGVSDGIRIGKVFIYNSPESKDQFDHVVGNDAGTELERLRFAKEKCLQELDELIGKANVLLGEDKVTVIKGQKSILADPSFYPEIEKLITAKLYSAEKAVNDTVNSIVEIFEKMPNDYMKERALDIKDVGRRLLAILSGKNKVKLSDIKKEVILISEDLTPSDTIQLDARYILAFATKKGGKTSHTAIFSRSLGIPAVLGMGDAMDVIKDGDTIILDGCEGLCIVNPEADTVDRYTDLMENEKKNSISLKEYGTKAAVTIDGHKTEVSANIGCLKDLEYALDHGAEGVGLYRTELLFMSHSEMPDEELQFETYKEIVEKSQNKTIVLRTLDIGGDKTLNYLKIPEEANPFLGYRAIRMCLDQQHLLLTQLKAALRSSVYGRINIMFPMIATIEEWELAKSIFHKAQHELNKERKSFATDVKLGIMIEVPSAALMCEQFAKEADFFSIGTNDLVQYTLAVDRMNEKVSYLYDHFNPAVIKLIQHVADAAHRAGKHVGMCGGMAGDPLAVPLLLGLGIDELSMSAVSIQKVKYTIAHTRLDASKVLADKVLELQKTREIRDLLGKFAAEIAE